MNNKQDHEKGSHGAMTNCTGFFIGHQLQNEAMMKQNGSIMALEDEHRTDNAQLNSLSESGEGSRRNTKSRSNLLPPNLVDNDLDDKAKDLSLLITGENSNKVKGKFS